MEDKWENMFVVGPDPKRLVFMRPEYRESAKNGLKKYFPQHIVTPNIRISKPSRLNLQNRILLN